MSKSNPASIPAVETKAPATTGGDPLTQFRPDTDPFAQFLTFAFRKNKFLDTSKKPATALDFGVATKGKGAAAEVKAGSAEAADRKNDGGLEVTVKTGEQTYTFSK